MTVIGTVDPDDFASHLLTSLELLLRQFHRTDILGGEFAARTRSFVNTLAIWGKRINLTAQPNDPDEIAFHIVDSLMPLMLSGAPSAHALDEALAPGSRILDLGSGSGFPGLILAAALQAEFTLIEARRKRASFLKMVAAEMGLVNIKVDNRRLDLDEAHSDFDTVVVRAVGTSSNLYQVAARMLRAGGSLVLYASTSQKLNLGAASDAGFAEYRKFPYEIQRPTGASRRILAVLRRS